MSRIVPLWAAALCAAVVSMAALGQCVGGEAAPAGKRIAEKKIAEIERKVAEAKRRVATAEKRIEEALRTPTQLEFIETPLQDVIDYLKDAHGIEIQLDGKALCAAEIGTDTHVTKNLKGISLRSALNLLLAELKLTYMVQDEVMLITTIEDAKGRLATTVYPVADLLPRGKQPEECSARCWELVRVITTVIAPESWRGGQGSIAAATAGNVEVLVVTQSYHVHRQVAELLQQLRKLAESKQPAS